MLGLKGLGGSHPVKPSWHVACRSQLKEINSETSLWTYFEQKKNLMDRLIEVLML